jgi:WD40 repeat protein
LSSAAPPPAQPAARYARHGPYQGLVPYTEEDGAWFFGRDAARAVVLDNLLAYRVSVLFGTSGVGKSSLLRAGVVRQVRDDARRQIARGEPAEYAALHFSSWLEDPLAGLQQAIGTALRDLSPELADDLPAGGSLADTVAAAALRVDGALLVILDQFEEYFLYHDADGPFITQLARLLARRETAASVLIAIREDALATLDGLAADMPGLLDNLVRIEHLDRVAARAAIIEPLELWNRDEASAGEQMRIEPELVEAVLDGVQTAESRIQTPYLQIVLTRLWDDERAAGSHVLRLRTLVDLGGAQRIVAEHVDNAIATLSPAEQAIAASVLRQLVTPSGSKIALRASDLADYAGLDEPVVTAVLERLTRTARVLQAVGGGRYEIYHDALARPILDWRGRWQARQDRLRERRRYRIVAGVAAGLVLTVVVVATLAVLAWLAQRDADRQAQDARAVALASASRDQLTAQRDIALLLGLAGLREKDGYETRSSLVAARQAAGPEAAVGIIRGHAKAVNAAAFLRGGATVVSAGEDGRILLADVATHRRFGRPFANNRGRAILSLAVSRDERLLAAADEDGVIRLWEIASRRLLRSVATHGTHLEALAFSPDGRMLASAADKSPIKLWKVPTLTPAGRSLRTPDHLFTLNIAFSPDGRTLAAVGNHHVVRRWSVRTRRRLPGSFARPGVPIVSVSFSPDGHTIATGGRRAMLWNISTGRARTMAPDDDDAAAGARVNDVVFSPDGTRLAGAGQDGATRLWNVDTGRPVRPPMRGPVGALEGVTFSPDGKLVMAFGDDSKVWLLDSGRPQTLMIHRHANDDVAFDRTGRTLATAAQDGRIRFWDVRSGRTVRISRLDAAESSLFVFAPNASKLATGSPDGEVAVWNLNTPTATASLLPGHPKQLVSALAFSPAADVLASSAENPTITLWDVASKRPRHPPLRGHRSTVNALAFSPDSHTLASADANSVRLWDLTTARGPSVDRVLRQADVGALAFSADGHTLASGDGAGAIGLTRIAKGGRSGRLTASDAGVLDVAFSPDGRILIAGDEEGAIRIWDLVSHRQLGRRLGPSDPVNHVAVTPDGRTFASDGAGFSVRLWSHLIWRDEDELRVDICNLVGTGLSRAEWKQYAPGIDYRPVCDE